MTDFLCLLDRDLNECLDSPRYTAWELVFSIWWTVFLSSTVCSQLKAIWKENAFSYLFNRTYSVKTNKGDLTKKNIWSNLVLKENGYQTVTQLRGCVSCDRSALQKTLPYIKECEYSITCQPWFYCPALLYWFYYPLMVSGAQQCHLGINVNSDVLLWS